jgi:Ca-activated chloride channel family protein
MRMPAREENRPSAPPSPISLPGKKGFKNKEKKQGTIADNKVSPKPTEPEFNTEQYDKITDNPFLDVKQNPLSTFSIDVDTASYANVRRYLNGNSLPPKDAVRIEELINYFTYNYTEPVGKAPFSVATEISTAPWKKENYLMKIALKGVTIEKKNIPPRNLVFLLDVSGSMLTEDKLPLVKQGLKMLLGELTEKDRISIVVYAGASGLVLEPTSDKGKIAEALEALQAGGSTNGGAGIELAYKVARQNFHKGGINRVILATDGDFNVGVSNQGDLIRMIEKERESGVFLTVLGFGTGNIKDTTMEQLANKGNGNYAYIDSLMEARKVLVTQSGGTLVTIAKDVKLQLEFNPKYVKSYRLIGYENRLLRNEDFNDDKKDAGEIGSGHYVTALYELTSTQNKSGTPLVDPLKYQEDRKNSKESNSDEILTIKFRYKEPNGSKSSLLTFPIQYNILDIGQTSTDFRFASAVASFGMLLRDSEHKGNANWNDTYELAKKSIGQDKEGYRSEFLQLVDKAKSLSKQ